MRQEKTTLEIIAPSVDEAIQNGLDQLGMPREAVEVEVLDQGSRGLFGLGGRQARVRLTFVWDQSEEKVEPAKQPVKQPVSQAAAPAAALVPEEEVQEEKEDETPEPVVAGDEDTLKVAAQVVRDLLERMKVRTSVSSRYIEAENPGEEPVVMVEIHGDDLSILIGRRSETLNALQYIASLIVGKEVGHWTPVLIDVQGYRKRRERQLRQLARRMAEQAVHTGRRQVLEPMPANERRLIHLELRDHADVATESVGDEPNRKVTIFLKK